jgi:hypothetical protein
MKGEIMKSSSKVNGLNTKKRPRHLWSPKGIKELHKVKPGKTKLKELMKRIEAIEGVTRTEGAVRQKLFSLGIHLL